MEEKYQNKYRIKSHRMPNWDYSGTGYYFITIVTQNMVCNLGKIKNQKMILSDFGKIIEIEWHKSFKIRNELFLDEFIMMPNHLHAIIILKKNKINDSQKSQNQFIRKPKSISSFIGGFKSAITTKIDDFIDENNLDIPKYNKNNHFFQPNYNDHIIRNNAEYHRIKNYIINNPKKWNNDKFNENEK